MFGNGELNACEKLLLDFCVEALLPIAAPLPIAGRFHRSCVDVSPCDHPHEDGDDRSFCSFYLLNPDKDLLNYCLTSSLNVQLG